MTTLNKLSINTFVKAVSKRSVFFKKSEAAAHKMKLVHAYFRLRFEASRTSFNIWSAKLARPGLESMDRYDQKDLKSSIVNLFKQEDIPLLAKIMLVELGITVTPINYFLLGIGILMELEKDLNPRLSYLSKIGGVELAREAVKGECLACNLYVALNGKDELAARRPVASGFSEPIFETDAGSIRISQKGKYFYLAVLKGPFEARIKEMAARFLMSTILNEIDTIKESPDIIKECEDLFETIIFGDISQETKNDLYNYIYPIKAFSKLVGKIAFNELLLRMSQALEKSLRRPRLVVDIPKDPDPPIPWR